MQKNTRRTKPFLIILFFVLILPTFIIFSPLIIVYSSNYVVKKVFNRELKFDNVKYSPINASLDIKGLTLSTLDGVRLFEIKRVYFAVSLKKLLMLNPVVTSIIIENPKTFIEKRGANKYLFPDYFKFGKGEKKKDFNFNLPFSIEEIMIKDGTLNLKEKDKYKDLLKDVTVIVPGIKGIGEKKEADPVISGKFFEESFNLKGKSRIDDKSMTNTFVINLNKFKIDEVSKYIPPIRNIKILSGTVSTNLNITFTTYKNKKPSLLLLGDITYKKLNLHDAWLNNTFLKDADGIIKIKRYDFINKVFDIDSLQVSKGKMMLTYSENEKERSTFFVKNKKSIYKTHIKNIGCDALELIFENRVNKAKYTFIRLNLKALDFYNYKSSQINFNMDGVADGVDSFKGEGFVNYKEKIANFNKINISGLVLNKFMIIPQNNNKIKDGIINKFDGIAEFSSNEIRVEGQCSIKEFNVEIDEKKDVLEINNADIDIKEWLVKSKKLSLNSLFCLDANLHLNKGQSLRKLKFSVPDRDTPYNFFYDSKDKKIDIKDDFKIDDISGEYESKEVDFDFKVNKININPDLKLDLNSEEKINGSSTLELDDIYLYDIGNPVLKIKKISSDIESIKYKPLYINLSNLTLDSPNFDITIKKDKKLYIFSLFKLKAENSNKEIKINIDKLTFNNGKITFTDYSLNKPFDIEINKLNGEIIHYPSTVYPEGQVSINGIIGNRNMIKIDSTISNALGIKGKLKSEDILLPQFTPYTEKFINYSIADGTLDLSSDYEINRDRVNISFDLALKNIRFIKSGFFRNGQDLSKIIPQLEDSDGKIKISMPPIKGKWDSPEFDFRGVFFDLFLDILSNTGKNIMPTFEKFKPDDTVDIVYFKAGRSDFLLNEDKIFSSKMLEMFKNKNKYFVIEGYADKERDRAFLKEEILLEKMEKYSSTLPEKGSPEELDVLKNIYLQMTGENASSDATNEFLKNFILAKINVDDSRYSALSYARINKIKDVLIKIYNIKADKIGTIEKDIFKNPYIEGVGNSIAVLKSGVLRE